MPSPFQAGFIAVVGRTNVGKSTLINEFIGRKLVITSHKAGTTRNFINAVYNDKNCQMIFIDTPGIHLSKKYQLNRYMNRAILTALESADVILWLVEIGHYLIEDARVLEHIEHLKKPIICCINKIDKLKKKTQMLDFLGQIAHRVLNAKIIPICAFSKKDVHYLKTQIIHYLPVQNAILSDDYLTNRSEKFLVAEFIREKMMRYLSNELPYDTTVSIEKYHNVHGIYHIFAKILVERASQKSIVIGQNGEMLKHIATDARQNIEALLGVKVFLKIWVKTQKNWRDDKEILRSLGYD